MIESHFIERRLDTFWMRLKVTILQQLRLVEWSASGYNIFLERANVMAVLRLSFRRF